jgi:hypothetical protein
MIPTYLPTYLARSALVAQTGPVRLTAQRRGTEFEGMAAAERERWAKFENELNSMEMSELNNSHMAVAEDSPVPTPPVLPCRSHRSLAPVPIDIDLSTEEEEEATPAQYDLFAVSPVDEPIEHQRKRYKMCVDKLSYDDLLRLADALRKHFEGPGE